jgi:hypothetical protein
MFDGFKSEHQYLDAGQWLNNSRLVFPLAVNEQTGEILDNTRIAKHEGLTFRVYNPNSPNKYYNELLGSLHKYHNAGDHNTNDFLFKDVIKAVNVLAIQFDVKPETSVLRGLEIGVNVALPFPVIRLLKAVICHGGVPFQPLDKQGAKKGLLCHKYEYKIKIYDKTSEAPTGTKNLLRFEIKVNRMRYLEPYGIKYLSDITNPDKVARLGILLLEMFSSIIMYDANSIQPKQLTTAKQLKLSNWKNANYWQGLNRKQRYNQRLQFDSLLADHNANTTHFVVADLIRQKWLNLIGAKHKNRVRFHHDFTSSEKPKQGTFSQLEYRVKTSFSNSLNEGKEKTVCKSCERDLSGQKNGSTFCSEKLYGKVAKKCRNKDSNKRYRFKQLIKTAMEQNGMIAVSYTDQNGNSYTDTLHATEICITREWLEQIQSIKILENGETLAGGNAKEYLKINCQNFKQASI